MKDAPSPAELAVETLLAAGVPPEVAARLANVALLQSSPEAQAKNDRRIKKLVELGKSWGAHDKGKTLAVVMSLLGAAAIFMRRGTSDTPLEAGAGDLFRLWADAVWKTVEDLGGSSDG